MARKRIPRRSIDSPPRVVKHTSTDTSDAIASSMTSSVRIILLLLIGLGICSFLFYPDITRVVRMLQAGGEGRAASHGDQVPVDDGDVEAGGSEHGSAVKDRHPRDLMEDEKVEDDPDVYLEEVDDDDDGVEPEVGHNTEHDGQRGRESRSVNTPKSKDSDKMVSNTPGQQKRASNTKGSSSSQPVSEDTKNFMKFSADASEPNVMKLNVNDMKREADKNPKHQKQAKNRPPSKNTKDEHNKNDGLPKEVLDFKTTVLDSVTAKKIFVDGRRLPPVELLPQKQTNSSVKVFLFDEFLSTDECDGLIKAHDRHVQDATTLEPILCFDSTSTLNEHLKEAKKKVRVTPNVFTKGTRCVNATFSRQLADWLHRNWSYSTAFYPGESKFSGIFANRVKAAMGLHQENGGKFQLTSYPKGKAYKSHTDCVVGGEDKRDRVATVLVYLQDVEEGGETRFPELGIWVKPRKGRALVWNNMNSAGNCEAHSMHTASKVVKGNKYVLLRWYYYQNFYSLGKRPPDAPLPVRPTGTPRVSCDEFEYGSCRWYDEWSYEHMLDYERQKMTLI